MNEAKAGLAVARIGEVADTVPAGLTEDQKRAFRYATQADGKLRAVDIKKGLDRIRGICSLNLTYVA